MYPDDENVFTALIIKRIEIIMRIQVCPISQINFDSKENGGKKRLFLPNQSINIVYPNKEKVFIVPSHQKDGDY